MATLQAAADRMAAGDTCVVHGGTYRQAVQIRKSGQDGQADPFHRRSGRARRARRHRGPEGQVAAVAERHLPHAVRRRLRATLRRRPPDDRGPLAERPLRRPLGPQQVGRLAQGSRKDLDDMRRAEARGRRLDRGLGRAQCGPPVPHLGAEGVKLRRAGRQLHLRIGRTPGRRPRRRSHLGRRQVLSLRQARSPRRARRVVPRSAEPHVVPVPGEGRRSGEEHRGVPLPQRGLRRRKGGLH